MLGNKTRKDHTELLCSVGELSGLFTDSPSLETFLKKTVTMIARHMNSAVCSIYLYYEGTQELVLTANTGLNPKFIGSVRLKFGEGLTGLALKERRPICERNASKNPNFRYFPGLGEEQFESFLAVPIIRGTTLIGALVIQNATKNYFSEDDVKVLRAIGSQLANTIETTRLILSLDEKQERRRAVAARKELTFIKGKTGSAGFALGEALVLDKELGLGFYLRPPVRSYSLEEFQDAVQKTEQQLESLQQDIEEKLSDVASLIFTAQILMLKDKAFIGAMTERIQKGENPPEAVAGIVESYVRRFDKIEDSYLKEKSQDILDIGRRLLENLFGRDQESLDLRDCIVIARELLPSDALKLSSQKVKGAILLSGGVTSHIAILAQSLQIPLVIADAPELLLLPQKTKILMDADHGNIYINPSREILEPFKSRASFQDEMASLCARVSPATETQDGTKIILMANINLLGDLKSARAVQAQGIGLYRTEFPFIVRNDFPGEEEQYVIYKKLVEGMPNQEISFRTLDIGGDKVLSYFEHHLREKNPYLGMRSIRFSLKHVEIFSQQIRAILRAGAGADIRIMFPMIASLDDFREAKAIVVKCIHSLRKERTDCHPRPQMGIMVELPSVMEVIDELAREADFFSIGTNDFVQYMLAVDRSNEKVADLYLPHHPAVLRALKKVVEAAQRHGKDVSICGDMAHEEKYLGYLLGIGIRKLSLNPVYLPRIQAAIKKLDLRKAEKLTESILRQSRLSEISRLLQMEKIS